MADVKDLFEQGEDVTELFNAAEDVTELPSRYDPAEMTQEPTALEGLGYGVQKGATLGFRDEIAALAGALGAKSGGDERGFWDVYYDILDATRQEGKEIEQAAPISTTVGEVGGGLLIPGQAFGKIAKGGTWLQRAGDAAKIGMKAGAVAGLGTTEAKLAEGEIEKATEDVASSAALGGLIGGTFQPAMELTGEAVKGVGKFLQKQPFTRDILDVFNRTKGGEELLGKVQTFADSNRELSKQIIDDLQTLRHSTGAIKQETTEQLADAGLKINVKNTVDKIREKIAQLDPTLEEEKADIEKFKKVLANIIQEEEKTFYKLIPNPKMPKLTIEQRAMKALRKKISQAQVRDRVRRDDLKDMIKEAQAEMMEGASEEEMKAIKAYIDGLKRQLKSTSGPRSGPLLDVDPLTGLPVLYSAKRNRYTLTESLMPDDPELFTPVKRIKDTKVTVGREEVDPKKLNEILRSLGIHGHMAETPVGKELAGETRDELKRLGQEAAQSGGEITAALQAQHDDVTEQFKRIAESQEKLKMLPYFNEIGPAARTEQQALDSLQQGIRRFDTPGSIEGQRINEAFDLLNKAQPGLGDVYRKKVAQGSTSERLARELLQEQQLGGNIKMGFTAPKALSLNLARVAGKAVKDAPEQAKLVTSKLITEPAKVIYNASPKVLQDLQMYAFNKGTTAGKNASDILMKVVSAPDSKKKALLFTLMQQPEFRNIVQDFLGETTGVGDDQ